VETFGVPSLKTKGILASDALNCEGSANEGLLSDDERAEYEALINAEDFVAILKLKARSQLSDAA
jgi:hypothetical protein